MFSVSEVWLRLLLATKIRRLLRSNDLFSCSVCAWFMRPIKAARRNPQYGRVLGIHDLSLRRCPPLTWSLVGSRTAVNWELRLYPFITPALFLWSVNVEAVIDPPGIVSGEIGPDKVPLHGQFNNTGLLVWNNGKMSYVFSTRVPSVCLATLYEFTWMGIMCYANLVLGMNWRLYRFIVKEIIQDNLNNQLTIY